MLLTGVHFHFDPVRDKWIIQPKQKTTTSHFESLTSQPRIADRMQQHQTVWEEKRPPWVQWLPWMQEVVSSITRPTLNKRSHCHLCAPNTQTGFVTLSRQIPREMRVQRCYISDRQLAPGINTVSPPRSDPWPNRRAASCHVHLYFTAVNKSMF